jgi:MFS family permease
LASKVWPSSGGSVPAVASIGRSVLAGGSRASGMAGVCQPPPARRRPDRSAWLDGVVPAPPRPDRTPAMTAAPGEVRFGTPQGRGVLLATVLGSGIAFLDSTVVNVALPTIADDLGAGLSGLQWILDSYLVTLSALLLLGGSLGDLFGRRRLFVAGLVGFTAASVLCGLAPNIGALVAARALQGVAAAMLVPGSLAIIAASFTPDDRARAVGAWSGLAGVASAIGPSSAGGSSTPSRGGSSSSSTCRSPPWPWSWRSARSPSRGTRAPTAAPTSWARRRCHSASAAWPTPSSRRPAG